MYQHDPRHVDVLVESVGLENGHTVQTPKIDDVKDENPAWLDSEQISKYRSDVARCLFLSQDRAGHNNRRERVVPKNVRSITTQPCQIEATRSVPEGREAVDPSFRIRGPEFRSDCFLGLGLGWKQRNEESVMRGRSRSWDDTFGKRFSRKQKIIARSSAEAELCAAALGASEAKGLESMMRDLGFAEKPVLTIDAKATEHILHRHGIGKNETHRRGALAVAR